jgi:alkylation response protein AidB-like acyl-CoA dehydrogenase
MMSAQTDDSVVNSPAIDQLPGRANSADEVDRAALIDLVEQLCARELAPNVIEFEKRAEFPLAIVRRIGDAGLLGLPYPVEYGGGGQPWTSYVDVLERLAKRWFVVAQAVHIHVLSCYPMADHGTPEQRARWLPTMLDGRHLGANCISEAEAGSDIAAIGATATPTGADGGTLTVNGMKAWTSLAGVADHYNMFCRTGGAGPRGLSVVLVPAGTAGVEVLAHERKMGARCSPTATVVFDQVEVPADQVIGRLGKGFLIAGGLFDRGRIGIAACAVGIATAAMEYATAYARQRRQFGQPVFDFQGVSFLIADMATQIAAARALLHSAARLLDARAPAAAVTAAAAQAKLFATDMAMRVTTDAVQVLGAYGYVEDHPVERWMREAKLLQIIEGTNQIQRMIIARSL